MIEIELDYNEFKKDGKRIKRIKWIFEKRKPKNKETDKVCEN